MKVLKIVVVLMMLAGCKAQSTQNFGGSGGSGGSGGGNGAQVEIAAARDACYEVAGRERMRVPRVLGAEPLRDDGRVVGADVTMRVQRRGEEFSVRCRHIAATGAVSLQKI